MPLQSKKTALIAILSSAAVSIYIAESFIPRPMPWLRFGFGNIIVLITLYLLGFRTALLVSIIKSFIGALLTGNFLTPAFLFSISGAVISPVVMGFIFFLFPYNFSPLGLSIWGALAHNSTQLLIASLILIGRIEVLHLLPFFLILSVITGTLTGIISLLTLKTLTHQKFI